MAAYTPGQLELLLASPLKRRGTRMLAGLTYRVTD